jgi:hypothetical protein
MLAEIFLIGVEAILRASKEARAQAFARIARALDVRIADRHHHRATNSLPL